MDDDDAVACNVCGRAFKNPGALARHLLSCDPKVEQDLHEQRVKAERMLEEAALLAEQVERDEFETSVECNDTSDPDGKLEMLIAGLMEKEGKQARFQGAAMACTTWREKNFMPNSHVEDVKQEISRYCEEGVEMAARKVAVRWDIPEDEVRNEISSVFQDYKNMGGTKKEKGIADRVIQPVYPCAPRVLGTRRNDKGNLIVVSSACILV